MHVFMCVTYVYVYVCDGKEIGGGTEGKIAFLLAVITATFRFLINNTV